MDSQVSAMAPSDVKDVLWAATEIGFQELHLESMTLLPAIDPEPDRPGNRFNDGKTAPDGSFWAGSMDDAEKDDAAGSWYRFDGKVATKLDTGFHVTNGPAFSPDGKTVFVTDSARRTIYRADVVNNGEAFRNKRIWKIFGEMDGYPDGMCFDGAGLLWVAFWDGSAVKAFTEDGRIAAVAELPVKRPTSAVFDNRQNKLFVTSAAIDLSNGKPKGLDGALFEILL